MKHSVTSHPISWFTEREREGNLTLQPRFQRRRVWTDRQKSNLIESILLQLPVPEIYMQIKTSPDGKSEYVIVDGQQRISSILEFVGIGEKEPFELRQLDRDSQWTGYTFNELTDEQKATFFGHSMAVRNLQEAVDDDIEDLFRRLNKYLTPLNPQELRNATYRGPFLRLSQTLADDPFWSENRLATPEAIRRMRDIEFVSDLLIGVIDGPQGGNPKTIDEYYGTYEQFEAEFPRQRESRRIFGRALDVIQEVLPDLRSTRWSNRTDFYSLFIVVAYLLRGYTLPEEKTVAMRTALAKWDVDIGKYQARENASVSAEVKSYVEASRRGSSDRSRRGARHQALLSMLEPLYRRRPQ